MGKLEELFSSIALGAVEATKVRLEENMIQVTGADVYVGPVETASQRACPNGKILPYLPGKAKHKKITDVDHLRPEMLFKPTAVVLPTDVLMQNAEVGKDGRLFVTFGEVPGSGEFELLLMLGPEEKKEEDKDKEEERPPRIWQIIWRSKVPDYFKIAYKRFLLSKVEPLMCEKCLSPEYGWKLQTSYRVKNPVLTVTTKTETLYHLLKYLKVRQLAPDFIVDPDYDQVYRLDGWKDSTTDFTKLIKAKAKEVKMAGKLAVPPGVCSINKEKVTTVPAEKPAEAPAPQPVAPEVPAVAPEEKPATIVKGQTAPELPAAALPAAPATATAVTDVPVAPAEEGTVVEKPKRQRRVKQATAVGFDFTAVLEYLGRPVTLGIEDIPHARDEVRTLRDLQIAAARRMANIYTGVSDLAGQALDKYAKIRELME